MAGSVDVLLVAIAGTAGLRASDDALAAPSSGRGRRSP